MALFSGLLGLSANAYVLPAPVFAPVRANFPAVMLAPGESMPTHYDDLRSRGQLKHVPDEVMAHASGPHGVGVESTWRPHDGKHEGYGQPPIAGLSKQQIYERAEMARAKDLKSNKDGLDGRPLTGW